MTYAVKSALVAVPAIITLLVGLAFVILCLLLVIELVRTMPYLKQALQIYIRINSTGEDEPRPSFWSRLLGRFRRHRAGPSTPAAPEPPHTPGPPDIDELLK